MTDTSSLLPAHSRRHRAVLTAAVAASLILGITLAPPALAGPATPGAARPAVGTTAAATSSTAPIGPDLKIDPALLSGDRAYTAFVRTSGLGALAVDAGTKSGELEGKPRSSEATARVRAIAATNRSITSQAKAIEPKSAAIYSTAYTVPGVALVAKAATFRALAARRDVVSIVPVVSKNTQPVAPTAEVAPANSHSDVLTQAVRTWQQTGHTGTGINVAIIDTGLDYTHTDFGGPGTRQAYLDAGNSTAAPQPGDYDPKKFLGGHDFAGTNYNADDSSPAYDPFPVPDDDPIDGPGGGHGTHVAGSIGGYGITTAGDTYAGDYTTLSAGEVTSMRIGPGTAPGVGLYSLKVFGDFGGSTNLTGAALDWVGEALTRGVSINVINLSLGSDYGVADDPDNAKITALLEQGVVPVIAQGNANDLTDIGGSPGNSAGALTVAAATNGHSTLDALNVVAPSTLTGANPYAGQYSINYQFDRAAFRGDVAPPASADNVSGCGAFSDTDKARVAGKIAWLKWDDSNVLCGSAARFDNAEAAGAIGVILTGTTNNFQGGIAGNFTIPGIELTADSVAALQPAVDAGTLTVELRDDLHGVIDVNNPAAADVIADFSSRGDHGAYSNIVKPDISAPGVNIVSAGAGQGNGSETLSGTSMATPITAGITALAFQAHPGWSAADIKADMMNTANHDVTQGGVVLDNLRQGAGRVDAYDAVNNQVTITSQQNGALVTASFGVVPVSAPTTLTRTLVLTNRGNTAATYTAAYRSRVAQSGVQFTLDRSTVTVPARGRATMTLTMTIARPGDLRRTINPTQSTTGGREFIAAASGLVALTPTGSAPALRLPVFAAPKPVSAMTTTAPSFATAAAITAPLRQQGTVLQQGAGAAAYTGSMAPFVLGATSPSKSFPAGSSQQSLAGLDVLAVGAASSAPSKPNPADGVLGFGVKMRGPISNPGAAGNVVVDIDVNGDKIWDFQTFTTKVRDSDTTAVVTIDKATGAQVDLKPYNENLDSTYSNSFDSSVAVLPVSLARLGYTRGTTMTTLSYRVHTESNVAPTAADGAYVVDTTPTATFNVFAPSLWFTGRTVAGRSIVFPDTTTGITVHRKAPSAAQILTLHLGNAVATQSNTVAVRTTPTLKPTSVRLSGTPKVGSRLTAAVSGWNTTGVTVTYQWLRNDVSIAGATGATYIVTRADLGRALRTRITGRKAGWNAVAVATTALRVR